METKQIYQSLKHEFILTCHECKQDIRIMVYPADLLKFQQGGGYIQDIFPYLSAGEREMFLSHICESCFDEIFADDDSEDDEE